MAYVGLDLPDSLPTAVKTVIRGCVEPLFQDVHYMLATTILELAGDGPRRQLQVPIAHILLAAVAGFSTSLCSAQGATGVRFTNCLTSFYPWDVDPPTGISKEDASSALYNTFRNPLVHYLGTHKNGGDNTMVRIVQIFRGTSDAEARIEELERFSIKPYSEPCLVVTEHKTTLWLDPLYWGVRKLVERWARDASEVSQANIRFTRA